MSDDQTSKPILQHNDYPFDQGIMYLTLQYKSNKLPLNDDDWSLKCWVMWVFIDCNQVTYHLMMIIHGTVHLMSDVTLSTPATKEFMLSNECSMNI